MVQPRIALSRLVTLFRRTLALPRRVPGYYRVGRMTGQSWAEAIRYAVKYGLKSLTSKALTNVETPGSPGFSAAMDKWSALVRSSQTSAPTSPAEARNE
jgi:hypothetical protein